MRQVLAALYQAVFVAIQYYQDPQAKIVGMHPMTDEVRGVKLEQMLMAEKWLIGAGNQL